jgi:hypothetical protein
LPKDHFAERERIVRLSRAGLVFCGMHAAYFVVMIVGMYSVGDSASVIFVALAVLPAGLLLSLLELLGSSGFRLLLVFWINNPFLLYPVNLVIAYLLGWALGAVGRLLVRLYGGRLDRLDARVLYFFDKDT